MKFILKALLPVFAVVSLSFADAPVMTKADNGAEKAELIAKIKELVKGKFEALGQWMDLKAKMHATKFKMKKAKLAEKAKMMAEKFDMFAPRLTVAELKTILNEKVEMIEKHMNKAKEIHAKIMTEAKKIADEQTAKFDKFKASLKSKEA